MRKTVLLGVLFCLSFISFGCQERSQQEIDRDYFEEVKKKAEKGDAEAQYFLAIMYEFGHSREPNAPEALVW
jgi:TPR repeat protein